MLPNTAFHSFQPETQTMLPFPTLSSKSSETENSPLDSPQTGQDVSNKFYLALSFLREGTKNLGYFLPTAPHHHGQGVGPGQAEMPGNFLQF